MVIRGLTQTQLEDAAMASSVTLYNVRRDGTGLRFQLKPLDVNGTTHPIKRHWQRIGHTGRKVHAVCWHGHREFYRECFKFNPHTIIITAIARYNDEQDFAAKYQATGDRNIGSQVEPMQYRDACVCVPGT